MFDFNSRKTAKHSEDINILEFVFNMHTIINMQSCSSVWIWVRILLFGENEKNLRRVYMEN